MFVQALSRFQLANSSIAARPRQRPSGAWRLSPGQAVSLTPARTSQLRIAQGHAWVTLGGPYQGASNDLGDRFLGPGDSLTVQYGSHLVIEPVALRADVSPVLFDWTPIGER